MAAVLAPRPASPLPEFGPRAVFGVLPDGRLASEDGYIWRTWPDGARLSGGVFREDASIISRDEFMRRIAASHAG